MTSYLINIETTKDACVLVAPRSKRESLAIGMLARLVFSERAEQRLGMTERKPQRERLWVKVTRRAETPAGVRYSGELVSDTLIDDLEVGADIEFGPEHVTEWDVAIPAKTRSRSSARGVAR